MSNFDVACPVAYPQKCKLDDRDKDELINYSGEFKAFFMYPKSHSGTYHIEIVKSHLVSPRFHIFDWNEDIFLGIKFCKICRLALASDFGIALLTPRNHNVFLEVGYTLGLSKPILYLFHSNNEDHLEGKKPPLEINQLPFDLGQEIVFQYEDEHELNNNIEDYAKKITQKVELFTPFQNKFRENIIQKIIKIKEFPLLEIVHLLLLENRRLRINFIKYIINDVIGNSIQDIDELMSRIETDTGFVVQESEYLPQGHVSSTSNLMVILQYEINPVYKSILQDIFFSPGKIESLINRKLFE
jgi:hypothetical protein